MVITSTQKSDVVFGVPLILRYLDSHFDLVKDMSRPQVILSGGDKIDKTEIIKFQNDFATKGCKAPIANGAGNNEVLGAAYITPMKDNRPGTVGIPMYGDVTSVFDPDTLEEKSYNEEGEICIKSEAAMLHYEGNEIDTQKVKRVHPDGSVWVHTGDLGKIDEDGFIYLIGRLSRVIIVGGFKIAASQIEEIAQNNPAIKEAVAVAVPDEEFEHVPMLYVVLNDEYKSSTNLILEELKEQYSIQLKDRATPRYFKALDKIPYTSNNKQDFRKLEQDGKEYVENLLAESKKYVKKSN